MQIENLKKVSNDYYVATDQIEKHKLEPEAVEFKLQGFSGFDFFYKKRSEYQYAAFDGFTGRRITGWMSNLISVGVEILYTIKSDITEELDYDQLKNLGHGNRIKLAEKFRAFLETSIEKYGLSPRWAGTEEKKGDLDWLF